MIRFARTAARRRRRSWFAVRGRAPLTACVLVALATLVAGVAGCGPDGGIVLEIHRGPGADSEIYRLEVRVGVGHDPGGHRAIDPAWWLAARVADDKAVVALPDGLGGTTFRYKLDAADTLARGDGLMVAVVGYGAALDSPPILFGHTSDAGIKFADGEVRIVDLPLETFTSARHGVGKAGCVWWNDGNAPDQASGRAHAIVPDADSDCDGYAEGHDEDGACQLDCNDLDPAISPAASEVCLDGIDQNCCAFDQDGAADPDGDGVNACSPVPDCVDMPRGTVVAVNVFGEPVTSEEIHPGATEICDGIDNDCAGGCDNDPGLDGDGDGWLNCVSETAVRGVHRKADGRCVPADLDCADAGPIRGVPASAIHPEAADDQCDQIDNDCSGGCDEAKVALGDADGDGYAACGTAGDPTGDAPVCRFGRPNDCNDADRFGLPGFFERCDGLDFNCDHLLFTDALPCFTTSGNRCVLGAQTCTDGTGSLMPIGVCMPDPNGPTVTLPAAFCTADCPPDDITGCITANEPTCDVEFRGTFGGTTLNPCVPAEIPLAGDLMAPCRWFLVGGSNQGDWKVTLQRGAASATSFEGCGPPVVTLRVLSSAPGADPRSVLIINQTRTQVVRLHRRDVGACDPVAVSCH